MFASYKKLIQCMKKNETCSLRKVENYLMDERRITNPSKLLRSLGVLFKSVATGKTKDYKSFEASSKLECAI